MATAIAFNTVKSMVISLLQASLTPYATTVDGSNKQFSSDTEIANAILTADGEVCTAIINTPQSPYQTTFVQTSGAISGPSGNLTARNGMVLKVLCQGAPATATFLNTAINTTSNVITVTAHGMQTGQPVTYTASATVPAGLTSGTTYYVIRVTADTLSLAATSFDAFNGTAIDITSQGTGGNTSTLTSNYYDGTQADSKDTIVQATMFPSVFGATAYATAGFWFIEGDIVYTTSPNCKVVYTDYTLTSSPQAPEPYLSAVVGGALSHLYKDGGDFELSQYYGQQYQGYLQAIASGAMILPAISSYKEG